MYLNIKVKNSDNYKITNFEKTLNNADLIYDYQIKKFNKDYIFYQIIFNGTPNNFLKSMSDKNFSIDTQTKPWVLK